MITNNTFNKAHCQDHATMHVGLSEASILYKLFRINKDFNIHFWVKYLDIFI